MNNFSLTQEFDGITYVGVIYKPEQIVVCSACFLLCCHVLCKVGDWVALGGEAVHTVGHTGGGNRVNSCGMVNKVRCHLGAHNLLLTQTAGELVNDGGYDLHMRQFFRAHIVYIMLLYMKMS